MQRARKTTNFHINLQSIKQYLLHGSYPSDASPIDKRSIRKRAQSFKIVGEDKVLYYCARKLPIDVDQEATNNGDDADNLRKVVFTLREQMALAAQAHAGAGTHKGIERTLAALTPKYYWVGMSKTVNQLIKKCSVCASNQKQMTMNQMMYFKREPPLLKKIETVMESSQVDLILNEVEGTLGVREFDADSNGEEDQGSSFTVAQSVESQMKEGQEGACYQSKNDDRDLMDQANELKSQKFWERVEIQILVPPPPEAESTKKSEDGRRKKYYIIVALDSYSKWPEAKKLDKVNELTVSQFIIQLISRFGRMEQLCVLKNDMTAEHPLLMYGITQNLSKLGVNTFSEEVNPYDDNWVRISKCISKFIQNYRESWSSCLDFCLMPLRNSIPPQADYSPSYILMGREPVFPNFILPQKGRLSSELLLSEERIELATDVMMKKFQECCNAEETPEITSAIVRYQQDVKKSPLKITSAQKQGEISIPFKKRKMVSSLPHRKTDTLLHANKKNKARKQLENNSNFENYDTTAYYRVVKRFVETSNFPLNSSLAFKRQVKKASDGHSIEDGKLFFINRVNIKKLVPVTMKERLQILDEVHCSAFEHLSKHKMLEKMDKELYIWKNMNMDVGAYVSACPDCPHGNGLQLVKKPKQIGLRRFQILNEHGDDDDETIPERDHIISSYPELINYLKTGISPDNLSRSQLVLYKKVAKNYKFDKGELLYSPQLFGREKTITRKVPLTQEERTAIIQRIHGDSHIAQTKVLTELRKDYLWHTMALDVKDFVMSCCQPELEFFGDKRDEELKEKIELFSWHFKKMDICDEDDFDIDTLFVKRAAEEKTISKTAISEPSQPLLSKPGTSIFVSGKEDEPEKEAEESPDKESKISSGRSINDEMETNTIEDPKEHDDDGVELDMEFDGEENKKPMNLLVPTVKRGVKKRCEVCSKIIRGENTFKEHMYKHTGVKPFTCEICQKKVTTVKSLRVHMRKHTGHRPYLCVYCGRGFPRLTSLRYHLKTHERGEPEPVPCDLCSRVFTSEKTLKKHKRFKHPDVKPVFNCPVCGKHFTAKRSLKRHQETHKGIKRYVCPVCLRSFFRKEYLTYHLHSHYKDNPEMYHFDSNLKRKYKRRVSSRPEIEKMGGNNIVSILHTEEQEMDDTETYPTQLVEVTNQVYTKTEPVANDLEAIFALEGGTVQVGNVVQGNNQTSMILVETNGSGDITIPVTSVIDSSTQNALNINNLIVAATQVNAQTCLDDSSQIVTEGSTLNLNQQHNNITVEGTNNNVEYENHLTNNIEQHNNQSDEQHYTVVASTNPDLAQLVSIPPSDNQQQQYTIVHSSHQQMHQQQQQEAGVLHQHETLQSEHQHTVLSTNTDSKRRIEVVLPDGQTLTLLQADVEGADGVHYQVESVTGEQGSEVDMKNTITILTPSSSLLNQ